MTIWHKDKGLTYPAKTMGLLKNNRRVASLANSPGCEVWFYQCLARSQQMRNGMTTFQPSYDFLSGNLPATGSFESNTWARSLLAQRRLPLLGPVPTLCCRQPRLARMPPQPRGASAGAETETAPHRLKRRIRWEPLKKGHQMWCPLIGLHYPEGTPNQAQWQKGRFSFDFPQALWRWGEVLALGESI